MKLALGGIALVAAAARAADRTRAPPGCLVVTKSPLGGQYRSIQAAVNASSTLSAAEQCIWIDQGTYSEQVLVGARSAKLAIYGYTADTSSYAQNKVTITARRSQADGLDNDETATLRVKVSDFKLYNINVDNGHGRGSQAVALSAYADSGYYGCSFTGFQDTLLANVGFQLFSRCLIQGATDFIFGQHGAAWFENCDIRVLAAAKGYVTANGRASPTDASYYVFNGSNIAAAAGQSVPAGAYYLGRPWSRYARVVFQHTAMSATINSAGWHGWSTADERTSDVIFGEYANSGAGSQGPRASFATKLSSAVSISTVLTSGYASRGYYDAAYM